MWDSLLSWFSTPLVYPFMRSALLVGVIVAAVCALLSCYLVLKGWSLMGDAISHAVLPGVVLAHLSALPLSLGAFLSGIFCVVSIGYLKENSRIKEDTLMGIVFSGLFAVGLVMFTKMETEQHLMHILFGDILGITSSDFWQILAISAVVGTVIGLKRKDFLLYCFDASHTRVAGLNATALHYGLLVLLALMIVSAMQVVGVILVVAMLITPGMTGYVLAKQFNRMCAIAVFSAVNSAFWGVLLSFHFNVATGATIVLLQAGFFLLALAVATFKSRRLRAF